MLGHVGGGRDSGHAPVQSVMLKLVPIRLASSPAAAAAQLR